MNCRSAQPLLLAELAAHLAACASCRQFRADLAAAMDAVRADVQAAPLPDIDAEWRAVQARINGGAAAPSSRPAKRRLAPVLWFSAPLAAAAAVALAFFVNRPVPTELPAMPNNGELAAHADYVEVADPSASPVIYTDKESGWLVVWAESADTAQASS